MQNATADRDHTNDFAIHIARPDDLTDAEWEDRKHAIGHAAIPVVSQVLGQCLERPWCDGVAGTPDHDEFHASAPIDLIPGPSVNGDAFGLSAWLVENRGSEEVRLVIDGYLPGSSELIALDVDAQGASALVSAITEGVASGASDAPARQLFGLLDSVAEAAAQRLDRAIAEARSNGVLVAMYDDLDDQITDAVPGDRARCVVGRLLDDGTSFVQLASGQRPALAVSALRVALRRLEQFDTQRWFYAKDDDGPMAYVLLCDSAATPMEMLYDVQTLMGSSLVATRSRS